LGWIITLQLKKLGEWRAEGLDYMWPGSDLLIMMAGGEENGMNEGTRRRGSALIARPPVGMHDHKMI